MRSTDVLTSKQRMVIKSTWRQIQKGCGQKDPHSHEYGLEVFRQVFALCPTLQSVFQLEQTEELDEIKDSHPFFRHARVFSNIMDLMVRNVDELEVQIAPALITYGRRHYYKHNVGFTPAYIQIFANAMMRVILQTLNHDDENTIAVIEDAWLTLIKYMVQKLKEGYNLEAMHQKGRRFSSWTP